MTDAEIENRFFNYPRETLELIHDYRRRNDPGLIAPVLKGILAKYAPGTSVPIEQLQEPRTIQNAFGLESLTLLEVILDIQDALGIALSDQELQRLQNFDQTMSLISEKVAALNSAGETTQKARTT